MEHERSILETADSVEDLLDSARRLTERYPALAPLLPGLLTQVEQAGDIDENDALACLRFHYKHPMLAESLMHMAQVVHEQASGKRHPKPRPRHGGLDDEWAEEPTIPT